MAVRLKPLREQTIVITGASSGIGLATARAAARHGARLVLAARSGDKLAQLERRINDTGGTAMHVVADVGRREDVQRIADAAIQRFGGFDTWINNAGVDIFGRLEEVSDADHHRLIDTNLWGTVYGSLIAVGHLRRAGGALINMGSIESDVAMPLQGMYSASKHAVKGFTDALRIELKDARAPVSVTLVKPWAIGTPLREHIKNYFDREATLPPPVYDPEEAARAILHAAVHPRRDVYVGGASRFMNLLSKPLPHVNDWLTRQIMYVAQLRDQTKYTHDDSLHQARADGQVRGEWSDRRLRPSLYTRASLHPVLTGAAMAAAGVSMTALLLRGRSARLRRKESGID